MRTITLEGEVEDLLNSSNLILKQDMNSIPTLLHRRHLTKSILDLSIISADIYEQTTVEVKDHLGSDHRPNLIKILKAKWLEYAGATDEGFDKISITNGSIDKVSKDI